MIKVPQQQHHARVSKTAPDQERRQREQHGDEQGQSHGGQGKPKSHNAAPEAALPGRDPMLEVRALAAGRDIVEGRYRSRQPAAPALFSGNKMLLVRHWNPQRPLEADQHATPLVAYSKNWQKSRGRYANFRLSMRALGRLLRSLPPF